ncbi:MAG TPA: universal stress protein [Geminicoccaceae bacterium]|nr:universal stress protein [Geminicoccaceae bacterium]
MSIRIILAPVFGADSDARSLEAAFGVAQRFGAHLTGLFVRVDPRDAIRVIGEGVSPAVIDQLTQAAEAEMDRRSAAARATFEAACGKSGAAISDQPSAAGAASAAWVELTGRRDEMIPRKARVSDLTVLCRPDENAPPELGTVLEATLFGAGRPLLIVPLQGAPSIGRTVAIAWNDSAEAARAVAGARPFIEAAGAVHVLSTKTWRTAADVGLELVQYLESRGTACTRREVASEGGPVGAALLDAAAAAGADLLVMGGYGRTRLSELVLGGVTRHVLAHSRLPILISH